MLYCVNLTSSLRQRVNGLARVKPDPWDPHVSDKVN